MDEMPMKRIAIPEDFHYSPPGYPDADPGFRRIRVTGDLRHDLRKFDLQRAKQHGGITQFYYNRFSKRAGTFDEYRGTLDSEFSRRTTDDRLLTTADWEGEESVSPARGERTHFSSRLKSRLKHSDSRFSTQVLQGFFFSRSEHCFEAPQSKNGQVFDFPLACYICLIHCQSFFSSKTDTTNRNKSKLRFLTTG